MTLNQPDDPEPDPWVDDPSDVIYETEADLKHLKQLEQLTAAQVIEYLYRAERAAGPYRPTLGELIRCAGTLARGDRLTGGQ